MASTDAKPLPIKNTAYRITFPIFDADGDLVTGATALDSEVSLDGGTFADCTNEATELATSSGMYYLDLTAAEMNADTVSVIIKTTSSGAKTTPIVLYPATGNINNLDATVSSVKTDTAAILLDTGTDGVVVASGSKSGYALSVAGVDAILDDVVEGTLTLRQIQRVMLAALAGKSSGGGTATILFKGDNGTTTRITATVDSNGNRTAITVDGVS